MHDLLQNSHAENVALRAQAPTAINAELKRSLTNSEERCLLLTEKLLSKDPSHDGHLLKSLQIENMELKNHLNTARDTIAKLQQDDKNLMASVENSLHELGTENDALRKRVLELEASSLQSLPIANRSSSLSSIVPSVDSKESESLRSELKVSQEKMTRLVAWKEKFVGKMEFAIKEIERTSGEKKILEGERTALEGLNALLVGEKAALVGEKNSQDDLVTGLQAELKRYKPMEFELELLKGTFEENEIKGKGMGLLSAQLATLQEAMADLSRDKDADTQDHEMAKEEMRTELQRLAELNSTLEESLDSLRLELADFKDDSDISAGSRQTLETELVTVRIDFSKLQEKHHDLIVTNADIQRELECVLIQETKTREESQEIAEVKDSLEASLMGIQNDMNELREEVRSVETDKKGLLATLALITEQKAKADKSSQMHEEKFTGLQLKIDDQERELLTLKVAESSRGLLERSDSKMSTELNNIHSSSEKPDENDEMVTYKSQFVLLSAELAKMKSKYTSYIEIIKANELEINALTMERDGLTKRLSLPTNLNNIKLLQNKVLGDSESEMKNLNKCEVDTMKTMDTEVSNLKSTVVSK